MKRINTDPVYTIGVAAKLLDVSVHLLRVYEKEGLILSERTPTGRRMFSDLEIAKVKCIRRMISENGINYEGLRRMFALVPCWRLRKCTEHTKESCSAFNNSERPCWATEEKCSHPLDNCRNCIVYRASVDCNDIKDLIYGRI